VVGVLRVVVGLIGTLSLAQALGRLWARTLPALAQPSGLALQLGMGLASLAYLMLVLGALGLYRSWLAWGLAVVSLPFGLPGLIAGLRASFARAPGGRGPLALAAFVLGLLGLAALRGLAPPTAWDSLTYHLTGPKLYLQAGSLHHDVDLPYLGFPQAGSMLFTWGMLLAGDRLAQWIPLVFAILTLMLLPQMLTELAPKRGWLAAAILIGTPTASLLAGVAYVEWIVMYAGLASFVLLTHDPGPPQPIDTRSAREPIGSGSVGLLAAAFMAAISVGTKYTAIWLVLGLAAVAVLHRRRLSAGLRFLGLAGVLVLPFLLKNLALTGNPIYPFLFPGKFWDVYRAHWYSRAGTGLSPLQLLIAPWEATVWGVEGGVFLGHPSYGASIGPLLLALAPASLLLRGAPDQRRRLRDLLVVAGFGYAGWLAQLGFSRLLVQTRLLFPILPVLAALAASGFEAVGGLGRWGRSARFVIGGLLALSFALTGLKAALDFSGESPLQVVSGAESQDEFLRARLGQYALAMEALRSLPPMSQVRFLWEPRSYYCPLVVECEPDALTDRWWHARQLGQDAAAVASEWRTEGVTHVLYYNLGARAIRQAGVDPLTLDDWAELEIFLDQQLVPLADFGGAYTLYRWR
jgi:hypothetical protein